MEIVVCCSGNVRSRDIFQSNVTAKFLACVLGVTLVLPILTLSGRWCWCASIRRRHSTFPRIQPKRQHFTRDCHQENGTLCHQHPSVDENQHAEAERRQNRDPHHPSEISRQHRSVAFVEWCEYVGSFHRSSLRTC